MLPLAVSVEEAARLLSCSERMVWNLLREGRLTRVKIGTSTRVSVEELRVFLSSGGANAANRRYPLATGAVA